MGLLLMFEEYRKQVADGNILLQEDHFVTDFHRRVFKAILNMQKSENGFQFAMLGEEFTPDEMGRIQKMEMARRELTQNGPTVFQTTVQALRAVCEDTKNKDADLQTRLETIRKSKLHKGKDQKE